MASAPVTSDRIRAALETHHRRRAQVLCASILDLGKAWSHYWVRSSPVPDLRDGHMGGNGHGRAPEARRVA
jgi:hypothetical protein